MDIVEYTIPANPRFTGSSQQEWASYVLTEQEAHSDAEALKCLRADIRNFKWRNKFRCFLLAWNQMESRLSIQNPKSLECHHHQSQHSPVWDHRSQNIIRLLTASTTSMMATHRRSWNDCAFALLLFLPFRRLFRVLLSIENAPRMDSF